MRRLMHSPVLSLLATFSWQELRQHPWRHAAAVLAMTLGVALAFSVQLINHSALAEFAQALRSVNGQADLELHAVHGQFNEALYERVLLDAQTATASPVLELNTLREDPPASPGAAASPLRLLGIDALRIAGINPDLLPRPRSGAERLAMLLPGHVFLNDAAMAANHGAATLRLDTPGGNRSLQVSGRINASGPPLAVMDLGAAQDLFAQWGRLSRIDLRLTAGSDRQGYLDRLSLPGEVVAVVPADLNRRTDSLSRAYRVNLTVLALVALFTGAFLVFSVLSLGVAQRSRQWALLGVLGLTPQERATLVLGESLVLGLLGSGLGIALGSGLAALALKMLGGDLGGGYFGGGQPVLQWQPGTAILYGGLGLLAALLGGWGPARAAQALPPAQALKGLGHPEPERRRRLPGLLLLVSAAGLAAAPPIDGMPLAAYLSVALLLLGGMVLLPVGIEPLYSPLARRFRHRLLPLLVIERARRTSGLATAAVGGVVASLSLAVALTVMVASFRDSVTRWLDQLLPAPLYVRLAGGLQGGEQITLPAAWVDSLQALPGVARVSGLRVRPLWLDPGRPEVFLIARSLDAEGRPLPLVQGPLKPPPDAMPVYISEAMADLYRLAPGQDLEQLSRSFDTSPGHASGVRPRFFIAGVWRDYARQGGSIVMDRADYTRLTSDQSINDLAVWPSTGVDEAGLLQAIRHLGSTADPGRPLPLELASSAEIRARSLRIFDRSFAVTYWLQAVAIAIGLFGVAASFSAQVLARRKEFGLLAHLGLSRRQILCVVAGEGAAWTAAGALAGLGLGLAIAALLVMVVNPQSFHWTMDLMLPVPRLALLCLATLLAGTCTAWLAGRSAAGADALQAVREDW